jgi:hypothetical protein
VGVGGKATTAGVDPSAVGHAPLLPVRHPPCLTLPPCCARRAAGGCGGSGGGA